MINELKEGRKRVALTWNQLGLLVWMAKGGAAI
jgi:hypothetical protein